ncbi:MAG: FAD-binding oxidoreductase [Chloroflexi bacterium]|nr:FAD-binding oxidoreductase [Chloroflexota bacterium]
MSDRRFIEAHELPPTADVVIIGGGPAGTSAAWALERAAPGTHIVLLEHSGGLAAGASIASLENFRTCWPAPCLARLMARSVEVFLNPAEYLGEGVNLGLKRQGYLYVAFTEDGAATFRRDVAHLHNIGLTHVEYLDAGEVAYRHPWLGGRVTAARFDPMAGWLDSHALVYAYANSTRSTRIALNVTGARIRVEDGCVTGVTTANGSISAPNVIIAAGANARQVGRLAGIEIPVIVRPRQSFTTPWRHPAFPEDAPCVISAAPFPHVRPEARDGAIFGWEYGGAPTLIEPTQPADAYKDPRFPSITLGLLARQFGHAPGEGFADTRYLRGIAHRAGYYVYRDNVYITRDDGTRQPYESQRAIMDGWPDVDGLFLSVAHAGHGIMSSPAAGEIIAAKVLRRDLPHPAYADFGLDVPYVEHDAGGLGLAH